MASSESKIFEQLFEQRTYQRSKIEGIHLIKDLSPGKQLSDKSRLKRCLFWNTSTQGYKEIYTVSLGSKFV